MLGDGIVTWLWDGVCWDWLVGSRMQVWLILPTTSNYDMYMIRLAKNRVGTEVGTAYPACGRLGSAGGSSTPIAAPPSPQESGHVALTPWTPAWRPPPWGPWPPLLPPPPAAPPHSLAALECHDTSRREGSPCNNPSTRDCPPSCCPPLWPSSASQIWLLCV